MSGFMSEIFPRAMPEGFRRGAENYGMLLEGMRMEVINHFLYVQILPIGAPIDAKGPPPKWLFKLLLKLHPRLRKRINRCKEVLAERTWQRELDEWNRSIKPWVVGRNQALQAVDIENSDDAALFKHLSECRQHLYDALVSHHTLTASNAVPLGRYLAKTTAWTGLPEHEVLDLLRGSSPSTAGTTADLQRLLAALRQHHEAISWLEFEDNGEDPATVLQKLLSADGELGAATNAYIEVIGNRLGTGYDVADRRVIEVPDVLLRGLAQSLQKDNSADDLQPEINRVRGLVPEQHRAEFDQLLDDAQMTHEIRDERIVLGDSWATGLARRALLEAGERLTARGRIEAPEHLVDATLAEIEAMFNGKAGPGPEQLAARHHQRCNAHVEEMPPFLGSEPGPPPPDEWLPPAAREIMSGMGAFLNGNMGQDAAQANAAAAQQSADNGQLLTGVGASGGSYEGTARVITAPDQMNQIQQGDILLVASTSPAFNVVLPLLGAIVTERGGMLCHAAVVAREYQIPAVAGVPGAMQKIANGQRLRIDGSAGTVELLN